MSETPPKVLSFFSLKLQRHKPETGKKYSWGSLLATRKIQHKKDTKYLTKMSFQGVVLREKSIEKAVKSWQLVQKIPNYETVVGQILFKQIFDLAPGAISMYGFGVDVDSNDIPESLFNSPVFLSHATRVVGMLQTALMLMLEDKLEDLAEALQGLGKRHVSYGVQAAHYIIVETALLRTLAIGLGSKWTPKLRAHWSAVIKFVAQAMMAGAASAVVIKRASATLRLFSVVSKAITALENVYVDYAEGGNFKRKAERRRSSGSIRRTSSGNLAKVREGAMAA